MSQSRVLVGAALALILLAETARADLTELQPGVYRLNFETIDDLLGLERNRSLRVVVVDDEDRKKVSDAHIQRTRDWVRAGGVVWAVEDGLESTLVKGLAPVSVAGFDYKKTGTGKRGGELIVRGVSPRLVIHDLPLTKGVKELFLYPKRRFDGTRDVLPIVEMTDQKGNHGLVLGAIRIDRGMLFLDGTARSKKKLPFGRLPGFDPDHPNAVKQEGVWRDYDWPKLLVNARAWAEAALAASRR